jgi:CelD/BcsL family acetyltransferase involved in cellulose biosynthesis
VIDGNVTFKTCRKAPPGDHLAYTTSMGRDSGEELQVEVITSLAPLIRLQPDYVHLQAVSGNVLPFALYEWHITWCRHFLGNHDGIVDEPLFHVFRTADGACVGLVPLIRTRRRMGGIAVHSLSLLGADPAITEIRGSLVQPGFEWPVARALHQELNRRHDWNWIHWMGSTDAFGMAVGQLRQLQWEPLQPSCVLDLPPTWEQFRAGLKRNIRESLRHCYNSLKRDGHPFTVPIAADPASVRIALQRLFVLHSLRAHMTDTVAHPDRFATPFLRGFVDEVCETMADRGLVRVFQIEIAGQIVASRIGFLIGDSLYLYYSGFDPAWSRYGVMTTAVAEAIKYAIAHGLKTVNLSPGNDVSKTRWGPREVPHQAAYEAARDPRSRLVTHAYLHARSGKGIQGRLLRRLMKGRRMW